MIQNKTNSENRHLVFLIFKKKPKENNEVGANYVRKQRFQQFCTINYKSCPYRVNDRHVIQGNGEQFVLSSDPLGHKHHVTFLVDQSCQDRQTKPGQLFHFHLLCANGSSLGWSSLECFCIDPASPKYCSA